MSPLTRSTIHALALENGLPFAVLVERASGEVVLVNEPFRTLFGLADESLADDPLRAAAATFEDPAAFLAGNADPTAMRRDRLRQRNGCTIERQVRAVFEDGHIAGWVWSCTDVTADEDALARVARVTEFYRVVLDALPANLAVFSPDGVYEYVTPSAIADPAVREWIIGKTDEEYGAMRGLPPAVSQQRAQRIRDCTERAESRTFEESFTTRTGEPRHFRRYVSPVIDAQGTVRHVLGYGLDITEQRLTEEQLRQSQKMDAVGRLAGGVAHDFNNLITIIAGYADCLREEIELTDERQHLVEGILDAGERASELTRQLLSFSRRAIIEPRVISINAVVEDTMLLLRRLLGEHIIMQLALTTLPTAVRADAGQLKQVLMNLAVNARDAMPSGGTLTLTTVRRQVDSPVEAAALHLPVGEYIELKVTDTGIGMSEDVRSHLFEPFFTTKPVGKGTGLGLSMVYGIVTQAGGQMQVDSTEGTGSSFRALLPALPAHVVPVDDTTVVPARALHHGTETLLVAEDEAGVRDFISRTLTRLGYTVLAADCGAEAVRLASEHAGTIDLLVADVVMPDFGGRTLWDALSSTRPDLRVLFISGYSDDTTLVGLTSAQEAFMHKPFGVDALGARVRALLDASAPAARTAARRSTPR